MKNKQHPLCRTNSCCEGHWVGLSRNYNNYDSVGNNGSMSSAATLTGLHPPITACGCPLIILFTSLWFFVVRALTAINPLTICEITHFTRSLNCCGKLLSTTLVFAENKEWYRNVSLLAYPHWNHRHPEITNWITTQCSLSHSIVTKELFCGTCRIGLFGFSTIVVYRHKWLVSI